MTMSPVVMVRRQGAKALYARDRFYRPALNSPPIAFCFGLLGFVFFVHTKIDLRLSEREQVPSTRLAVEAQVSNVVPDARSNGAALGGYHSIRASRSTAAILYL